MYDPELKALYVWQSLLLNIHYNISLSLNSLRGKIPFKFNVEIRGPVEKRKDNICLQGVVSKNSDCPHS